MGDEPNVLVTHVLVDIDQDKRTREENTEKDIAPVRNRVGGIQIWIKKKEDDKDQSREEKGEKKKVEVDLHG